MVGREVLLRVEKAPAQPGDVAARGRATSTCVDDRGIETVRGVSFDVRAGEIVGIAGVDGNGQTRADRGDHGPAEDRQRAAVAIAGRSVTGTERARDARRRASATSRRTASGAGLVLEFSIAENIALHDYASRRTRGWGWLFPARAGRARRRADPRVRHPRRRPARRRHAALSGGNQQKVVVAREIARDPKVLIAAQPTRGLDVGAIEYLHRRLVAERDEGRAVLLVSLELEEILSLSDRILVIYEGQIVGEHRATSPSRRSGSRCSGGERGGRVSVSAAREPPAARATADATGTLAAGSRSSSARAESSCRSLTGVVAFLIGGLVVLATGHNPLLAYRDIFNGAGLNWVFHPTTDSRHLGVQPLADAAPDDDADPRGLAVAFAFRCGMFNIGGQGQYFVGLVRRELGRLRLRRR